MISTVHEKGGTGPVAPPPPPTPANAGQRVDRQLTDGRKRRLGYQATILGGSQSEKSGSILGG